jgi:hypothetical protein
VSPILVHDVPGLTFHDFAVFESDLECCHVQNGQSFAQSEPIVLLVGYAPCTEAKDAARLEGFAVIGLQTFKYAYLYHDPHHGLYPASIDRQWMLDIVPIWIYHTQEYPVHVHSE